MYQLILELVGKNARWSFDSKEIRIGRDPNCDLVLPTELYPMVSRSHLLIRLAADRFWVDDLNSSCGTFVNGIQVGVAPLSHGDVIQLGGEGPQLKVCIGVSPRSSDQQTPVRKRSLSNEDTTKFRQSRVLRFRYPLSLYMPEFS
jgi:pSer/pThr/pTyr-binding forkhead associated (FHA) protein